MSTLRLLGSPPVHIARRLSACWRGTVLDEPDGPADAVLAWDDDLGPIVDTITRQRRRGHDRPWWLHTRAAGVDPVLLDAVAGSQVVLTKGSGAHAIAVAEHVLALLLALCKRLPDMADAARSSRWEVPPGIREVHGSTVTIVGFGAIGRATARLLTAFGATVIAVRRADAPTDGEIEVLPISRLDNALHRSSILVIAAPLTPATDGLIGPPQLSLLHPGSLLVNVGRGRIVQQAALLTALQSGQLAGAALDVFDVEPLPRSSDLWITPNVMISPHCADATPGTDERALDLFLANADRWRKGAPLSGLVDPATGY